MIDRRILAILATTVLVLLAALIGLRQIDAGTVTAASQAASQAQMADAIALLEAPGALPRSATSLHDAGVYWYQSGDVPRAIAAWRAARELAPRDVDLVHNLAVARADLSGTPPPVPSMHGWMDVATPGEVGLLAFLAWMVASSALWSWKRHGDGLETALVAGILAIVLSIMGWMGRDAILHHPPAVTVAETVVRDGPDLDAGQRFVLAPGSELRTHAVRGPFVLVQDGQARRGWVLAEAVAIPSQR